VSPPLKSVLGADFATRPDTRVWDVIGGFGVRIPSWRFLTSAGRSRDESRRMGNRGAVAYEVKWTIRCGRSGLPRPAVGAISASVDDVRGMVIERRRDALPSPTPRAELAHAVGASLARAARTIAPVTIPVAAWWIARRAVRLLPSGALMAGRTWRGSPATIVLRWAEATIYRSDEHGRLERRSFGTARVDVER
jgi:hypothetical protein